MSDNRPPSTLEGAFMLHQLLAFDWPAWNKLESDERDRLRKRLAGELDDIFERRQAEESGACYKLLGHKADLLLVHLRHTPEELVAVQRRLQALEIWDYLTPTYSYFSVVELSLHGAAHRYSKKLAKEGLEEGTEEWERQLEALLEQERDTQRARLYPELPDDPYICFYPMNKTRGEQKNWFMLKPSERAEMMKGHGKTGRKYFGRVTQIVSSSVGLDDYDWGVDLFAKQAVDFKKLIYEMRFDEVSAVYAEFGPFYVGVRCRPAELLEQPTSAAQAVAK